MFWLLWTRIFALGYDDFIVENRSGIEESVMCKHVCVLTAIVEYSIKTLLRIEK